MVKWLDLFVDPPRFFAEQSKRPAIWSGPLVLVGVFLATTVVAFLIFGTRLNSTADVGFRIPFAITYTFTILSSALGGLATWLLLSGAVWMISGLLSKERPTYGKLLEFMGYAHLPLTVYGFGLVLGALTLDTEPISDIVRTEDSSYPFVHYANNLRFYFYLWALLLGVIATAKLYRVSYGKAITSIAAPVVLLMVFGVGIRLLVE